MLDKNWRKRWDFAYKEISSLETELDKRIDQVIKIICSYCDVEDYYIDEGEYFDDIPLYEDDNDIYACHIVPKDSKQYKNLTNEFNDYSYGFPQKFLWMADDEIKSYLKDEFERSSKKTELKKKKQKEYREKTKQLKIELEKEKKRLKKKVGIR